MFLTVKNESELNFLLQKIKYHNLKYSVFIEPDIGNKMTAIAIQPGELTQKLTSHLPLALKEFENNSINV